MKRFLSLHTLFFVASIVAILWGAFICWPPSGLFPSRAQQPSCRLLDRNGRLLRRVLSPDKTSSNWVELRDLPPHIRQAFVAAEDKRFFQHPGIDPIAISRAALSNLHAGRIVSGGSTLTQQWIKLSKNLPHGWIGKLLEAALALRLESWSTKSEILENYLNTVPLGNQTLGLEAAARLYFDKPARHLSLSEACYLAGLPQAPSRYNPYRHPERAKKRQQYVFTQMIRAGWIDTSLYLSPALRCVQVSPPEHRFAAPHFCDAILSLFPKRKGDVYTTLDFSLQTRIRDLVRGHLKALRDHHVTQAAVLVLDNRSRQVLAWVGSGDYFKERNQGQVDGVRAKRQPGSALKPFTYALALEQGYTPASILPDIETHASATGEDLAVHNYDETFHGPVRLRTALACSYNVPAVRLLESLGTDLLLSRLSRAGITTLDHPPRHYGLGLTLGNGEVTLFELTRAYAALANDGFFSPISVFMDFPLPDSSRNIFSPDVSFLISDILSDPAARAPAFGWGSPLRLPFPCAAKTGTTKDYRDNWTVGYTRDVTVGVWVGNFDGSPMKNVSGISGAAPLFRSVMLLLHRDHDPEPFTAPDNVVSYPVCPLSGQRPGPYCEGHIQEWFVRGTEPSQSCTVHQNIAIDNRSGQPATATTPKKNIAYRVYTVWPAPYHNWMTSRNLPILPDTTSPRQPKPVILFPDDGDIFKIDPILRKEYQVLHFSAQIPAHIDTVQWILDDSLLAQTPFPFTMTWPMTPGRHRLTVQNPNQTLSSEITFQVLP